jgi:D-alanyl-D-alanine carboxypeptidase
VLHGLRIFVIAISLSGLALPAAAAGPSLLFDAATGKVLSQERAGEPWYPASLTKMMTAYVIFQKLRAGTLKLDQQITVSPIAAAQEPSKLGVPAGGTIKLNVALQSMLVYSANDMAYALAEAGSGSVGAFVTEMNGTAKAMGLAATHYVNPNGLFDPRQLSSARDLAVLTSALIREFPEHQHYFSQPHVAVGKRKLMNRNSLIHVMPEADGMKTGFVCNSGFNLVASATRGGRRLVSVVLGAPSANARADIARMMLEDGFARSAAPVQATAAGQAAAPAQPTIQQLQNMALGAIVPADLTSQVCKNKRIASAKSAREVSGWGISFGTYEDMTKADMALRGRLVGPLAVGLAGTSGVIRMPDKSGYAAMLWNLDSVASTNLCNGLKAQNALCTVITPQDAASIAALAAKTEPAAPVITQGSDNQKTKRKPARKKRVKKTFN